MAMRHGGNLLYYVQEPRMPAHEAREGQLPRQALMSRRFRCIIRFAAEKPSDAVLQFAPVERSNNKVVDRVGGGPHEIVVPGQDRERRRADRGLGEPVKEIVHRRGTRNRHCNHEVQRLLAQSFRKR
jgi:hypothetical protein